ncbi:response regulator containing a CheY-like receiver domain and a GGDEF domain [Xenococcus sp. PCC 7305]|uniref:response regulator n=1 Tax=Xenococcus sp. PCC 7305 TaxID=102125 RepID=UPI0002AC7CE6|nr:response regulator [Xenococcus sp. PCC 7305]ELS03380.1 response regulator containing a CheY-like receiver domain and a GGDEF domain [Xenococcus sp. PCC 7305]
MGQDLQQASVLTLEDVLKQLAKLNADGCLQISYNSIVFFVYLNQGQIVYATNSLAPFERLERHLRRLSNQNSKLTNDTIKLARQKFRQVIESYVEIPSDYRGILWLADVEHLNSQEVLTLVRRITREVFESILCLPKDTAYQFTEQSQQLPEICQFELAPYIKQCHSRIEAWQTFAKHIKSSFQRLYLVSDDLNHHNIPNLTAEQNETISKLLKGLNFRQISALIDKDELIVAKILYPSIVNNNILVRNPKSPFNRLPSLIFQDSDNLFANITHDLNENLQSADETSQQIEFNSKQTIELLGKRWKISFVDHNLTIDENFAGLLGSKIFDIYIINDPMKAFEKLIEFQPEVIFLAVDMPNINGYELCGLLRNHNNFKTTPIILISENKGLPNSSKLKLLGVTDNLIKPFTQESLLSIVLKNLH